MTVDVKPEEQMDFLIGIYSGSTAAEPYALRSGCSLPGVRFWILCPSGL